MKLYKTYFNSTFMGITPYLENVDAARAWVSHKRTAVDIQVKPLTETSVLCDEVLHSDQWWVALFEYGQDTNGADAGEVGRPYRDYVIGPLQDANEIRHLFCSKAFLKSYSQAAFVSMLYARTDMHAMALRYGPPVNMAQVREYVTRYTGL